MGVRQTGQRVVKRPPLSPGDMGSAIAGQGHSGRPEVQTDMRSRPPRASAPMKSVPAHTEGTFGKIGTTPVPDGARMARA